MKSKHRAGVPAPPKKEFGPDALLRDGRHVQPVTAMRDRWRAEPLSREGGICERESGRKGAALSPERAVYHSQPWPGLC
jgi:hypothetical protein